MTEQILVLKDHRRLRYGIFGNPKGVPVIDFHGIPGSYLEAELIHSYLGREDVCLIGFDRPGFGKSSLKFNFQVQDIVPDVLQLIDHLGINKFAALGYSGGGPFAAACACFIPGRVGALGIVSGVGPAETGSSGMHESNRKKFNLAQQMPWLARILLWFAFTNLRMHPNDLARQLEKIWKQMPEPDQKILFRDSKFKEGILKITRDAIQAGVSGWANEEILMAQPWQFRPQDVNCPNVFLWHGEQDRNVPAAMARKLAEQIPGCQAHFFEHEAHISLLYNQGSEIMNTLIAAMKK